MTHTAAARLSQNHSPEHIKEKLGYLDFLQAARPRQVRRPLGWLRQAIEEDYGPPEGFAPLEGWGGEPAAGERPPGAWRSGPLRVETDDSLEMLAARLGETDAEKAIWAEALKRLAMTLPPAQLTHFAGSRLLRLDGERALVLAADERARAWLNGRLAGRVRTELRRLGRPVETVVVIGPADIALPLEEP